MAGLILFVAGIGLGLACGFGLATYYWTNGHNDLSGEYVGAAVQLAEAVDQDLLVMTRLNQFRNAKGRLTHVS